MSRLNNLSPIDFEELCRDIAQAEIGDRFSAFGPGPDGGIDGRHATASKTTILQCKHYSGSTYSALKKAAKKEAEKISILSPSRYLFFTSQSLTPKRSKELSKIFGDVLKNPGDIWGLEDIEGALKRHPEIEKSHIKLWLSSAAVLERILQSGLEAFTQAVRSEIEEEVKIYAHNPSFDNALKKLDKEKILIISGPPGVGKTTLAKMITYSHLNDGWKFYAINSLDDGFSKIDDETPTVFFFDDFLGRIELNRQSLLQRDTAISIFANRIRKSKNARFILTTRAHIFEEARRISDHIDDQRLQLSKYLLDVGEYTRKIKSHIFFNHLSASSLTQEHFLSLIKDNWLIKIVDHKNYNPRIIASVTSECLDSITPTEYPKYIYHTLDNPDLIWSKPFESLDIRSQNLLIALFFGNQYGQEVETLRENYLDLNRSICSFYSQPTKPNDFEDSLRSLESGFISITDRTVSFVNPSLNDFLKAYLTNKELLEILPGSAKRADWIYNLWEHIKEVFKAHEGEKSALASKFSSFATIIGAKPTHKYVIRNGKRFFQYDDLPLSSRAYMLFEWWEHTHEKLFLEKALMLLKSDDLRISPWRDGPLLPELHWRINNFLDENHDIKSKLLTEIEEKIEEIIVVGVPVDDLIAIIEKTAEFMDEKAAKSINSAIDSAANYEFTETREAISHLDTEEELSEHINLLDTLANLTGYDSEDAKSIITERIAELDEEESYERHTSLLNRNNDHGDDDFSDDDLNSLFFNLIRP